MQRYSSFNRLVTRILGLGNFDHPDLEQVDAMGQKAGLSQRASRQAFFVARDKKALIEGEILDGGSGKIAKKTKNKHILDATFSNGEYKG
jgi:hypothetical protein